MTQLTLEDQAKKANMVEKTASDLMLLFLAEEEVTGEARIFGTMWDIAERISSSQNMVSLAMRLSRTEEFVNAHGYSFPSLGNGRSGARHGYVLEYHRDGIELAEVVLHAHARRLATTLRNLTAQYALAADVADGRTSLGKEIGMALKAVDLAADALEVGLAST